MNAWHSPYSEQKAFVLAYSFRHASRATSLPEGGLLRAQYTYKSKFTTLRSLQIYITQAKYLLVHHQRHACGENGGGIGGGGVETGQG